ncbi:hypothetical protein GGG16DRAFT_90769 [Schizophyllum commune]
MPFQTSSLAFMAATDAATTVSSASPSTISSTTAATAASAMSSSDDGGMARGANYFFGFLITFVALLLIFVGCGVGTRHRRMRGGTGFMFDWNTPAEVPKEEPRLYEGYLEKAQGDLAWVDVMPVSATILRPKADEPVSSSSSESRPPPRRTWLDRLRRRATPPPDVPAARPSEDIERKARRPRTPSPPPPDETLQITMMIAMPTPPRPPNDTTPDEQRGLDEYQLGVLQKPWRAPPPSHAGPSL